MLPPVPRFLAASAIACAALVPTWCHAAESSSQASCKRPDYPRDALQRMDEGVTLLGFLIGLDGGVRDSVVLSSSGSRDLDKAARETLSTCRFKPATANGEPVEHWTPVMYKWAMSDDPGLQRAKHKASVASIDGDAAARYQLALLFSVTATTDAERERARTLRQSAAEQGYAHAQFDLGIRYERGDGVPKDLEEARRWYVKAAAQGDVLAVQWLAAERRKAVAAKAAATAER